jgi:uncharacterized protein (DUF433 family)
VLNGNGTTLTGGAGADRSPKGATVDESEASLQNLVRAAVPGHSPGKRENEIMTDIDWSDCPIVQSNPKKLGGVPTVRAWRVPADTVVENHDYGLPDDEIAYQYSLPIEDVRAILAYAQQFRQATHAHLP